MQFWKMPLYDKLWRDDIQMQLTKEEGEFLREQIIFSCPDSMLAYILKNNITEVLYLEKFSQLETIIHIFPEDIQEKYNLALSFSNFIYVAQTLYNIMVSDGQNKEAKGILCEWENSKFAECPSFMKSGDKYLLTASVCKEDSHRFSVMYGTFEDGRFTPEYTGEVDKGPDQYAGQVFLDRKGRTILISWMPGWKYAGYRKKDIGCMSVPREIKLIDGKIYGYPVEEVQHLLKDSDPAVIQNSKGFKIRRTRRKSVVYKGEIEDLKIIRDGYILEVFVNGGEEIYSVLI